MTDVNQAKDKNKNNYIYHSFPLFMRKDPLFYCATGPLNPIEFLSFPLLLSFLKSTSNNFLSVVVNSSNHF